MTQDIQKFEPEKHLRQLPAGKGKTEAYLDVKWRLIWFRQECPQGTIRTEMLLLDFDRLMCAEVKVWNNDIKGFDLVHKEAKGVAVFRTTVEDGKGGVSSGTKMESAVNFADYAEKAETGSIGRALAGLGYGTQFVGADFDEDDRLTDSPVARPAAKKDTPATKPAKTAPVQAIPLERRDTPPNQRQLDEMTGLLAKLGKSMKSPPKTYAEAETGLAKLRGMVAEKKQGDGVPIEQIGRDLAAARQSA